MLTGSVSRDLESPCSFDHFEVAKLGGDLHLDGCQSAMLLPLDHKGKFIENHSLCANAVTLCTKWWFFGCEASPLVRDPHPMRVIRLKTPTRYGCHGR